MGSRRASGKRSRSAAYELAIRRFQERGVPAEKGDRISYYIQGTTLSVPAFESARLAEEWNADEPDENTTYYLKRLDEFADKFRPFFEPSDFRNIFSTEDLFGFDASNIPVRSLSPDRTDA